MIDPATDRRSPWAVVIPVYACFFLSGATGLVYEIAWMRMLGLVFGHTVYAVTAVLTAFMAGLGLGALLFGKIIDRRGLRPLKIYGLLEAGIGVYCLLVPFFLAQVQRLYLFFYTFLNLSFFTLSLAQFGLVFVVLLIPTTLMGATLPVLSKLFVERLEKVGEKVGGLYALNTFGAVIGSAAAGFFLLPAIGVSLAILLAAVINLAIGAVALAIDRALGQPTSSPAAPHGKPEDILSEKKTAALQTPLLVLLLAGIGLSGAASMVYEIAWTRALVLVIGSSTYAFSAMLTTFLVGLALGSFLFAKIWGKRPVGGNLFGFLEFAVALTALALVPAFDRMPDLVLNLMKLAPGSYGVALLSQFSVSFLVMIVPTVLIGAAFPCIVQITATRLSRLGQEVGIAYSVNTLGTVLGAFVAGFFLVPAIGVQSSIYAGAAINAAVGAAVLFAFATPGWRQWAALPLLALFAAGLAYIPKWEKTVMTAGAPVYALRFVQASDPAGLFRARTAQRQLLFYKEGITSTVSVERNERMTSLRVNGKTDASDGIDMATQLMLGHLPMLLHPNPERALIIGLGSGVSAGAMAQHPALKMLEVVELEPAIIQAAAFFAHVNRNVLRDPRVRVVVADGRNFILASREKYDVISSEPSNPWMAGVANLFSREFYELARERLSEDGIMVQWIHGYSLFPQDLRMVINTFRTVFPHATVWWTVEGDYLLVGGKKRLVIDYERIRGRYEASQAIQEDFKILGWQSPLALFTLFLLDEEDTGRLTAGARLNTDDQPLLEFSAPLALYASTVEQNHRMLREVRTRALPPVAGINRASLWTADRRLRYARALWARGDRDAALEQLEQMGPLAPTETALRLERAKLLFAIGRIGEALEVLSQLRAQSPGQRIIESYLKVGRFLLDKGLAEAMVQHGRTLVGNPNPAEANNNLGVFYTNIGVRLREPALFELAVDAFKAALQVEPQSYAVINNLANAYFEQGLLDRSAEAYHRVIQMRPNLPETHFNLGLVYERQGAPELAAQEYRTALGLRPGWEAPRLGLSRLQASPGSNKRQQNPYLQLPNNLR